MEPKIHRENSLCEFYEHGTHELQLLENGEADLHKHFDKCEKNPGHCNFVPYKQFTKKHLPRNCRDNELFSLIQILADLTVRIGVTTMSTKRPLFWPVKGEPYPLCDEKIKDQLRTGTGRVSDVRKYSKDIKHKKYHNCPCKKCLIAERPCDDWVEIEIYTAKHVIFDEHEAELTFCRLFYDAENSLLVNIDVVDFETDDVEKDWCMLICATCDLDIMNKLDQLMKQFRSLWRKVYEKYMPSRDRLKMTLIVSHPHGCPKHISVGEWSERNQEGEYESKYTYSTATCPGSSGASVFRLGYSGSWFFDRHVHSGTDPESKLNHSSIGWDDLVI